MYKVYVLLLHSVRHCLTSLDSSHSLTWFIPDVPIINCVSHQNKLQLWVVQLAVIQVTNFVNKKTRPWMLYIMWEYVYGNAVYVYIWIAVHFTNYSSMQWIVYFVFFLILERKLNNSHRISRMLCCVLASHFEILTKIN